MNPLADYRGQTWEGWKGVPPWSKEHHDSAPYGAFTVHKTC